MEALHLQRSMCLEWDDSPWSDLSLIHFNKNIVHHSFIHYIWDMELLTVCSASSSHQMHQLSLQWPKRFHCCGCLCNKIKQKDKWLSKRLKSRDLKTHPMTWGENVFYQGCWTRETVTAGCSCLTMTRKRFNWLRLALSLGHPRTSLQLLHTSG